MRLYVKTEIITALSPAASAKPILKMGAAAEVLEQGARSSHKVAVMVVGELADAENGSARVCYEVTGTAHQLDMHRCTLDGEPRDWLLY